MIKVFHHVLRTPSREARSMMFFPKLVDIERCYDGAHPDFVYTQVAEVETNDLDYAYQLTNTFDALWWHNHGVKQMFHGKGCRSTSVGDYMETADGKRHAVMNIGFEEMA